MRTKEYKKQYYLKNQDKYSKKSKERYLLNRSEILKRRSITRENESEEAKKARLEYLKNWRQQHKEETNKYRQTIDNKFKFGYKYPARKRGYEFKLSFAQFTKLFIGECRYCGVENARGIDRVDNNIGYIIDNCVSCCGVCNKMKWKLNQDDFLEKVKQIFKNTK